MHVHGAGPVGVRVGPGHTAIDGEVDFERARAAPECVESTRNTSGQTISEDAGDRTRRQIEHRDIGRRQRRHLHELGTISECGGLDCPERDPGTDSEMSGVSGRIRRGVEWNRTFGFSCHKSPSVASDFFCRLACVSRSQELDASSHQMLRMKE